MRTCAAHSSSSSDDIEKSLRRFGRFAGGGAESAASGVAIDHSSLPTSLLPSRGDQCSSLAALSGDVPDLLALLLVAHEAAVMSIAYDVRSVCKNF